MVSSFGGALSVIGVRAVINDLNQYINGGKRIEAATDAITRKQEQLGAASSKVSRTVIDNNNRIATSTARSAERENSALNKISDIRQKLANTRAQIAEKEQSIQASTNALLEVSVQKEQDAIRKVVVARQKLLDVRQDIANKEKAFNEASAALAEKELRLESVLAIPRSKFIDAEKDANVVAARKEVAAASSALLREERALTALRITEAARASDVQKAEQSLSRVRQAITNSIDRDASISSASLSRLRRLEETQTKALEGAERNLGVVRNSIGVQAASVELRNEELLTAAKTAEQIKTEQLAAAEANLAKQRGAGLRAAAIGGVIVGGFLAAGTLKGSIGAASDYEDALVRIDNFTEATTEETERLGKQFLELSKVIPKSPSELGVGAYIALSSGISDVNQAYEITKESAKLASAANVQLEDIVRFVTRTTVVYGEENIKAAQAIDILSAAIQAGSGEPKDFADQLARSVGIARQLNIPLDELASTFAALTNVLPQEQAGTGLLGILNQLISPSDQARERLEHLGTSIEEIKENIVSKGFPEAMRLLADRITNIQELGEIFPDVRGLNAFLSTFRSGGEDMQRILDIVRHSAGLTEQNFQRFQKTASAQFKLLQNNLNVSLILLGTSILPAVNEAMSKLVNIIKENEDEIRSFVKEGLDLLLGTAKLVLQVVGGLISAFSLLVNNEDATKAAILAIGAAFTWALPGGFVIKGLTIIAGLLSALGVGPSTTGAIKNLEALRNKGLETLKDLERRGISPESAGYKKLKDTVNQLNSEIDTLNKALSDTKEISVELGEIKLPKLNLNMDDLPFEDLNDRTKKFVDILEDGIISMEEAAKKGWDAITAGGVEAFEFMRREQMKAEEASFNLAKSMALVATAFQKSQRAAETYVLTLARESLERTTAASSALFSRPTQEMAELQLQIARANLITIQKIQQFNPLIEAEQRRLEARNKSYEDQLEALNEQRKRLADIQDEEEDLENKRKEQLQEQIDENERHLENLRRANEDERRAMDRARQLRERDLDDAIDALNKQKDFLERRQDLALGPSAKRAIQKQIDAIDAEIEQRKNSAEAQKRQEEDREFQLREEQIARDREEEDRKEALQRQIDSLNQEIDTRKNLREKEVKALDQRIDSLNKQKDREIESIQNVIKHYQGQIDQGKRLEQHFQDQADILNANHRIWQAEIDIANKALLSEEELKRKHDELTRQVSISSEEVRKLSEKLSVDVIPEMDEARFAFQRLQGGIDVLENESIRSKFIPYVDAAALHAQLLAEAAAHAAGDIEESGRRMNTTSQGVKGAVDDIIRSIREKVQDVARIPSLFGAGGRPTPGEPAIVGDTGPEWFIPDKPGTVLPVANVQGALRWLEHLRRYFPLNELKRAVHVMALESGGNQFAIKDDNIESSYGLFQINLDVHPLTKSQALDAEQNIAYAADLFRRQGWYPWTAARTLGFAEHGGIVSKPGLFMIGENHKKEMILPLTDIPRSRELMASIPPAVRAGIMGSTMSNNFHAENVNLPNVSNGESFIPEVERYQARKLRLQKRGV